MKKSNTTIIITAVVCIFSTRIWDCLTYMLPYSLSLFQKTRIFCTLMQETTLIFMHANSQPTTKAATMAIGIKENNISTLRKYLPFNIDFYAKK